MALYDIETFQWEFCPIFYLAIEWQKIQLNVGSTTSQRRLNVAFQEQRAVVLKLLVRRVGLGADRARHDEQGGGRPKASAGCARGARQRGPSEG